MLRGPIAFAAAFVLALSAVTTAQTNAVITGTVRDATGAVLPGVTVEVSSPALIEKARTAVTDGIGQYKILELSPGTYTVSFALTGFSTVRREGIVLTTGFTATINSELRVGAVEETITVAGSTPVVDVQNVKQQVVMGRDVVDNVPSGNYVYNLGVLIPGVVMQGATTGTGQDVGGTSGQSYGVLSAHGGRGSDMEIQLEGMNTTSFNTRGTSIILFTNGNFSEYAIETAGRSAEAETGGIRMNLIPREGGNTFRGIFSANGAIQAFEGNNISQDLIDSGLPKGAINSNKALWEWNPTLGGPIFRNRLWFFGTYTGLRSENYIGGLFYNVDPAAWRYQADSTRQGYNELWARDAAVRFTWQATPRNKIGVYINYSRHCQCKFQVSPTRSPEAGWVADNFMYPLVLTWTSPVTGHLLFEGGFSNIPQHKYFNRDPDAVAASILEQNGNFRYRANTSYRYEIFQNKTIRGAVTYVARGHTTKVGVQAVIGSVLEPGRYNPFGNVTYRVLNGVPNQVTYDGFADYPGYETRDYMRPNLGIYAQDQWTVGHFTLNGGLRFDQLRYSYGDYNVAPTRFVPVARVGSGAEVLNWKSLSPRLGATYDLFGDGKTALKVSAGKFIQADGLSRRGSVNPLLQNNSTNRTWDDLNFNLVPDGDPFNPARNDELGPTSNSNFGKAILGTRYDDEWAKSFNERAYNWEFSASIQHELLPRVGVNAAYFRRIYGNFEVTDNLATAPIDYDSYCVTAPRDVRLPDGGGQRICGLVDLSRAKVGQVNEIVTAAKNYGKQIEHWNGVDLSVSAKLGNGLAQGGISTGKTTTDNCELAAALPEVMLSGSTVTPLQYCHNETPFLTQFKLLASYTFPWQIQLSGTLQNLPGVPITASYVATSAQVATSLGRGLSSSNNVTVNIVEPNTLYGERMNQLDFRIGRIFQVKNYRMQANLDLFNALNGNTVLLINNTYGTDGATWLVPQGVLPGRIAKLSIQVNF
jgi:hypothetical protein